MLPAAARSRPAAAASPAAAVPGTGCRHGQRLLPRVRQWLLPQRRVDATLLAGLPGRSGGAAGTGLAGPRHGSAGAGPGLGAQLRARPAA
ncbi:hypothetical protein G6F21_014530 [Rhizopus arrhizus]|nr:hypothetical protein G6F21_014530 [Rhizopus arrhizus]